MVDTDNFGIGGIIILVVVVLIATALLPPAIGAMTSADFDSRTANVELSESESYNLSDTNVSVTLDSVNATGNNLANYTFADNGDTASISLAESENETVTVAGTDFTTNVTEVSGSQNTASAIVTYQVGNGGGVAGDLWNMIPLFMILAVALYILFMGLNQKNEL